MNAIDNKFSEIRDFCEQHADPVVVKKYAKYFTDGYDAYGLTREIYEHQQDKWIKAWKDDLSIRDYLLLGDKLITTGKYEEASFAIAFIYSNRKWLTANMFEKLGNWLENGIDNWAHTDFLSGKVLSYFITHKIVPVESLKPWLKSESIWKKRAVPVTLIEALKKGISIEIILAIIDPFMSDKAKKVQQGLGWLLREAWKRHPEKTEAFLMKWKDICGRTIIQYATEKMEKSYRIKFAKTKK